MKQKLKTYLKIGILAFGITFAVTSCTTDELDTSTNLVVSEAEFDTFKKGFKPKHINEELLLGEDNFQVDWNSANIINFSKSENKTVYEFSAYLDNPITTESKLFSKENIYKLIVTQQNDRAEYKVIRFEPFEQSSNLNPSYKNLSNFSGNKYELNQLGRIESLDTYENGEVVASLDLTEKTKIANSNLASKKAATCNLDAFRCSSLGSGYSGRSSGGSGSYQRQTTYHYTVWYKKVGNSWQYTHTKYNGKSTKWVYVRNNSGGYKPTTHNVYTHHGPSYNTNTTPVRIINNLTGKAKCIYDKLKTLNGNLFKETIASFMPDPTYDLILKNGNCATTDEACTDGSMSSINGQITITIENDTQHGLGIAAAILHEAIHANMWRYIAQYKTGVDENDKLEVFRLYRHYASLYGDVFNPSPNTNPKNDIDHIYMNLHYIIPIERALRQLDNNRFPEEYYKAYAMEGLRGMDPYSTLSTDGYAEAVKLRDEVEKANKICE